MAPRIDVGKWNKTWHKDLSAPTKLLYAYLWDVVDEAGVWEIDRVEAATAIDSPDSIEIDIQCLIDAKVAKYLEIDGISYLWLTRYCLQHKTLSDRYKGHRSVIRLIRFYNLFDEPVIKSLFRDGYQYSVDLGRRKLNLDVNDKEQDGERSLFNAMTDTGICLSWQDWRRLCQLYPEMDKNQVIQSIAEIIPDYMPGHVKAKGAPKPSKTQFANLWKMVVDIAEYSTKGVVYTPALAESLKSQWHDKEVETCLKNKKAKANQLKSL